jgi:hypothetical protein
MAKTMQAEIKFTNLKDKRKKFANKAARKSAPSDADGNVKYLL